MLKSDSGLYVYRMYNRSSNINQGTLNPVFGCMSKDLINCFAAGLVCSDENFLQIFVVL